MKLKTLLYGTAAILVSTGATNIAQAADLPAAAPVDYVRICDAFGRGFFYIPGTDTCLRIGGYVRIEYRFNETDDDDDNLYRTRARYRVNLDARTETDLGLLRAFIRFYQTLGPGGTDVSAFDLEYSAGLTLDEAFITLSNDSGQWTFGKTASFFDFWGGQTFTGIGGLDYTDDATMVAYTFNIGNGLSASISLEDPYAEGRKLSDAVVIYGGQQVPDLVVNFRADQGWGSGQIMAALRQIRPKEFAAAVLDDELGWAIGAGLEVAIPGAPVDLFLLATYGEGMVDYVTANGLGAPDGVLNAAGLQIETTEAWQVSAGITIAATPTIDVSIDGAYGDTDVFGLLAAGDGDFWGIAGNVVWNPVRGFIIGGEIQYNEFNPDVGVSTDAVAGRIRVQRSF